MTDRTTDPTRLLPLTPAAFHILVSLTDADLHGYAIKRDVEARTGGVVRLGAGTLYHAIGSLGKRGLVEETDPPEPDAGSSRRRFYRITRLGRRVLELEVQRLAADVEYASGKLVEARGDG
ncbi:MAG TPA: PadR family transcriptional regulator [Longimicrobiales bacterium]|nr:PadR family transcriptional regulator [Longimicrobiales bacterium]